MNRQTKTLVAAVVLIVLAVCLLGNAACKAKKEELVAVRYRGGFRLGPVNAADWAALEEGYFAAEGIEALMTPGTNQEDAASLTAAGEYDIASSSAVPAIMGIAEGMPIKVVAMIFQHGTLGLIALESSGIRTPKDIEGRNVGIIPQGETYAMWHTFVELNDLDLSTMTEVAIPYGYESLFAGDIDIQPTNVMDGPLVVEKAAGEPAVVFPFSDYPELDRYASCLIVNNKFAEEHSDLVRGFVKAYLKGMVFVMENPDKATDHLLAQSEDLDEEIVRAACESAIHPFYMSEDTKEHGLGHMTAERWQKEVRKLVEGGVLEKEIPVEDIFTNEYLPHPPIHAP